LCFQSVFGLGVSGICIRRILLVTSFIRHLQTLLKLMSHLLCFKYFWTFPIDLRLLLGFCSVLTTLIVGCLETTCNWTLIRQFIWLGSAQQLQKIGDISLTVGRVDVVGDLRVTLDLQLSMKQHVDCIHRVKLLLPTTTSAGLSSTVTDVEWFAHSRSCICTAYVVSRLDYCNAVLYGVAALWSALHTAVRFIPRCAVVPAHFAIHYCTGCPLFSESITKSLGWRSTASVAQSPAYVRHFCRPVTSVGARADHGSLVEHIKRYCPPRSFGFHICAPVVWNKLPSHARTEYISREQLTRELKTYPFPCAYSLEAPLWTSAN